MPGRRCGGGGRMIGFFLERKVIVLRGWSRRRLVWKRRCRWDGVAGWCGEDDGERKV